MMSYLFYIIFMFPLCFKISLFMQLSYYILFIIFVLSMQVSSNFLSISYFLGCDYLSFFMIMLSVWICLLMLMASETIMFNNIYKSLFMMVLLFINISLYMTFSTFHLFMFYLFFEISLIPILMLILGWGYQPERIQAGMYMMMYTLLVSLPFLISIFYIYYYISSFYYFFLLLLILIIYMFLLIYYFFVKMPMYLVHLWLPKAHVEAPVAGSMILAGVLLKLGGYGLIRLMVIFYSVGLFLNIYVIILSLVGGLYISLICLRQSDMKSLIAYSSVSHMSLVLSGLMSMNLYGLYGAVIMMIAHGLCSSGLFCLANISYERTGSRSFFLNKGLINLMPNLSLWWFIFCSFNMAAPPSLNLIGELMLINSLVSWGTYLILVLVFLSFFGASYSLYLYSFSQHGKLYAGLYSIGTINMREYLLLLLHFVPLVTLFLLCDLI
uniref:NADH-ubiquinone oxidoreductase chain 4 n=1 Tax=Dictyoptera aurora TaxID=1053893 RepID=A0A0S2MNC3_9COLE|nr:NADH deshydrogenase subunit 4 [Dictyoptera aurora]